MKQKYKSLLVSSLAILPLSMPVFGATSGASEELPSYLDKQQDALVSQNSLMADTSSQSYTEESTDPFTSFYMAAGPNWVKTDVTVDEDFLGIKKSSTKKSKSDLGGNFGLGYGATFNDFYLGGEAFLNYVNLGSSNGSSLSDYDFGAGLKFGYLLTHKLMVYALAGVDVIQYKTNWNNSSDKKTKIGFMPGIGAEYLFNDNWGIRSQYTYTFFPKLSYSTPNTESTDIKTRRSNLGLDVVYRFNY